MKGAVAAVSKGTAALFSGLAAAIFLKANPI
jgi:hypothetical protein